MKRYKLPFSISLERKYSDINIECFEYDWLEEEKNRQPRKLMVDNGLHIEMGKFHTYGINMDELIDLGMRYSLGKQEFRKILAVLINIRGGF